MSGGTSDVEDVARSPLSLAPAGPRTEKPTCVLFDVFRGLEQRYGLFELSSDDIAFRHPHAEANSVTSNTCVAPQAVQDLNKMARAKLLCHWPLGPQVDPTLLSSSACRTALFGNKTRVPDPDQAAWERFPTSITLSRLPKVSLASLWSCAAGRQDQAAVLSRLR